MRETRSAIWTTIIGTILVCFVIGTITIFSLGLQAQLMPWWFGVQRAATEQSKSFIDSQTQAQLTKITEYQKLEVAKTTASADTKIAIEGQQEAIYSLVCSQVTDMATGTVARNVRVFLSENGKCLPE